MFQQGFDLSGNLDQLVDKKHWIYLRNTITGLQSCEIMGL